MTLDLTQTFILLRDWHEGDRTALDRLLERDLDWVRQYVVRRMGNLLRAKGQLDDYVQDAVVRALQYAPPFLMSDRDQFRALLGRITENVLRDNIDRITAARRDAAMERPTPSDSLLHLDPPSRTTTRPSEAAARNEEQCWVRLGIDLLPAEERNVVLWREYEGLSFAEIAGHLGIQEDAARMRFNRILPKLARTVQKLKQGQISDALAEVE
jgi:RNA polymerase sigma-70 factor (ECF subfamily)